jgi:hypothetical protein
MRKVSKGMGLQQTSAKGVIMSLRTKLKEASLYVAWLWLRILPPPLNWLWLCWLLQNRRLFIDVKGLK